LNNQDFITFKIRLSDDSEVEIQVSINMNVPIGSTTQHFLVNDTGRNLGITPVPDYILLENRSVYIPHSDGKKLIGVNIT